MTTPTPKTIYRQDYLPPHYLIDEVDIHFTLDAECTLVLATLKMRKNPAASGDEALVLHGEGLELLGVAVDGVALDNNQYQQSASHLRLAKVPQNQPFTLQIKNTINPAENTALEGLYQSENMLCTQCEAQGFRKITYYLDRPDVMAKFTVTLLADKADYPVLLSNGDIIDEGEDGNRHWRTFADPHKKPCYLFALVGGNLQRLAATFTTASGKQINLQIFVASGDIDKCDHALASLQNAMRWDEENYGREYDLATYTIVAVSHFNSGAMENKGLNIFNSQFVLARPDTATDGDYMRIEGVIGHEYFHNWTGNRVTCRDWFQLSLKEGWTVQRDQQFSGWQNSTAVKRIEDVKLLRERQFAEDAGKLQHPIRPDSYMEIDNFYTVTVYEKGAEVVGMIATILGKKAFRCGADLYFARHDGCAVTCDDFVTAMADASGVDLQQFRRWYAQAGTPVLPVSSSYDASRQTLSVTISQSNNPNTEPLHIPIRCGLLYADGSAADLCVNGAQCGVETTLELTCSEQTFVFSGLVGKPVLSLLRGFSAPVILHHSQSMDELYFLFNHDPDPFSRWEAGQKIACQIIADLLADYQQNKPLQLAQKLVDAYDKILRQPDDLAYAALLLELPSEAYLATQMAADVAGIAFCYDFVRQALAQQLQTQFAECYRRYHQPNRQINSAAMAKRRIKNVCLDYLACLQTQQSCAQTVAQFTNAENMTDQLAALQLIIDNDTPAKDDYLQSFYQQWQGEALVIDKWFSLQAASQAADALTQTKQLLQHRAFSLANPNRARSLIATFSKNTRHFHAADGSGYKFLRQQIAIIDQTNPKLAARMATPLTLWENHKPKQQELMKGELQILLDKGKPSPALFEIASKGLG